MNIGILGVGEIGRAIVEGLHAGATDGGQWSRTFLSPRGARTVAELSRRHQNVHVCTDNQDVVDRSQLVILAVRPQDLTEALADLRVTDDKVIVNVMAGVSNEELRRALATDASLVRAIPLPAVRERRSITVTYPTHSEVNTLFDRLGGTLPAPDEASFNVFSALTATLTSHYWYLATITSWAAAQGITHEDADRYIRGLFQGVGRALEDTARSLPQLAADHETPGGINERIRTSWFSKANADALQDSLDELLDDLRNAAEVRPGVA